MISTSYFYLNRKSQISGEKKKQTPPKTIFGLLKALKKEKNIKKYF